MILYFACVKSIIPVRFFATPWTVARQTSLSMGFPRQKTRVDCHFLLQGIFPTQWWTLVSCLAGRFFNTAPPGKLKYQRKECRHLSIPSFLKIYFNSLLTNNWAILISECKQTNNLLTRSVTMVSPGLSYERFTNTGNQGHNF